jgi:hypothetical protein
VTDVVSGSSTIEQRKGFMGSGPFKLTHYRFMKLLDKPERDDVLIVTKLDRLGRNAWMWPARSSSSRRWGSAFTASPLVVPLLIKIKALYLRLPTLSIFLAK